MSTNVRQTANPGAKSRRPIKKSWSGPAQSLLPSLQVHLTDENAQMLFERMKSIDEDSKNSSDWSDVKSRILQLKPQP